MLAFCPGCRTGHPCADFGVGGQIDLKVGISNITRRGEYEETSAPAVVDDLVIMGSAIADNDRVDSPNGVVRALMPETASFAGAGIQFKETWGLPEQAMWSTISVDAQRGLVFLPTGSASPDLTASKGLVITNGRTPSLRCLQKPANWCGVSARSSRYVGLRHGSAAGCLHLAPRWRRDTCRHSEARREPFCPEPRDGIPFSAQRNARFQGDAEGGIPRRRSPSDCSAGTSGSKPYR